MEGECILFAILGLEERHNGEFPGLSSNISQTGGCWRKLPPGTPNKQRQNRFKIILSLVKRPRNEQPNGVVSLFYIPGLFQPNSQYTRKNNDQYVVRIIKYREL